MPTSLTLKVEKVATPFTAATVTVPDSEAPLGLVPSATVTLVVVPVTVIPDASSIATRTAGAIAAPAAAVPGCTVKASCVATLVVPVGAEVEHAPSASVQAVKRAHDQKGPADADLGRMVSPWAAMSRTEGPVRPDAALSLATGQCAPSVRTPPEYAPTWPGHGRADVDIWTPRVWVCNERLAAP